MAIDRSGIKMTTAVNPVSKSLNGIAKGLRTNKRAVLGVMGAKMLEQIQDNFDSQADPVTGAPWPARKRARLEGGDKLLYRTGALRRSWLQPFKIAGSSVSLGSNLVYANIQNYGGTVKPKQAQVLCLPLTKEAARAGSARRFWERQPAGKKPFFLETKSGGLFIVTSGPKKTLAFHFVCLDQVAIPRRRYVGWGPRQIAAMTKVANTAILRFGGRRYERVDVPGGSLVA